MEKHLIQVFLPLTDNTGQHFPGEWYQQISTDFKERFGGVTIFQQAPVTGLWKEDEQLTMKDELIIFEVMTDERDLNYWTVLKTKLEKQFRQGKYSHPEFGGANILVGPLKCPDIYGQYRG